MFVHNHMTPDPTTIGPQAPVAEAWNLMRKGQFHQLPVVDANGGLLGIVTDRDIRSALGYDPVNRVDLLVEEVMSPSPICLSANDTVESAILMFCRHHFGAFPVMRGRQLAGIISRLDLLRAFRDLLGLEQPGHRIEVALPNGTADLCAAVEALADEDHITSLIAARLRTDGPEPVLYIHTCSPNPWQLETRLRSHGAILLAKERVDKAT